MYNEEADKNRLLNALQDVVDGNILEDPDQADPVPLIEEDIKEDIIERIDTLENQEIPQIPKIPEPEPYESSKFGKLEAMRLYLEDELGHESLMQAYDIVKNLQKIQDNS